jgi:hypothetical protein
MRPQVQQAIALIRRLKSEILAFQTTIASKDLEISASVVALSDKDNALVLAQTALAQALAAGVADADTIRIAQDQVTALSLQSAASTTAAELAQQQNQGLNDLIAQLAAQNEALATAAAADASADLADDDALAAELAGETVG